jgi:hypothetical protein
VGLNVVGRKHLHDLLVVRQGLLHVEGHGEMPGSSLFLRQRLVSNPAQEVLEETVVAPLRRLGVSLDPQELLSDQRGEEPLEIRGGEPRDGSDRGSSEGLAQHRGVLD